ncbi:Fe-S cluster assembly protein SufD [Lysobacter sp. GX 14042]|uniref:Fe-S cluster assembly protein SufD n=1 Tax=Lysobacter sp. GX 14042 TaxID=2907155 RepID=UPI001F226C72|nr:Fe-S cluster assembly protein SufD [Lysobacter sp. GX 14042]MCE7031833.1 Fe-S cluster assembly protein SufD [Lysobacter sp. GX 14042]
MSALMENLARGFDALPGREAAGLGPLRREALAGALRDGLPGPRSEAWKYTPLRALERRSFAPAGKALAFDAALLADIPAPRLVFVNGRYDAAHSDLEGLPAGVSAHPLSQLLEEGDPVAAGALSRRYQEPAEVFARLNTALATEGVVLRAGPEARGGGPVRLVFIGTPDSEDRAWHLRHRIELAPGARLDVIEQLVGGGEHRHLANSLMQVELGDAARLRHARLQQESSGATLFHRTDAVLGTDAQYRRIDLELGAALSRHELNIALRGARAQAQANGVLLADGRRHLDTRLSVDHDARDTGCELTWRGIGADRGKVVFHGGILIREGADGTNANLSNKNLLLSQGAEIDTQPMLVIHADEVQAAHGATVGQLDPTAMFYLRSRGIPAERAQGLLTAAFCREPLSVIDDQAVRDAVGARLDEVLLQSVAAGMEA